MKKLILSFLLAVSFISKSQSSSLPIVVNYELNDTLIYKYYFSWFKCCPVEKIIDKVVVEKTILGIDSVQYVFYVTESTYSWKGSSKPLSPDSVKYYNDTLVYSKSTYKGMVSGFDSQNNKTMTKNFNPSNQLRADTSKVYTENLGLTRQMWYRYNGISFDFRIDLVYAKLSKIYGERPKDNLVTNFNDEKYNSYFNIQDNNLRIFNYDKSKPVYIYNMQGVMSMQITGKDEIDLSILNNGLYQLNYTSLNNVNETKKIIKE